MEVYNLVLKVAAIFIVMLAGAMVFYCIISSLGRQVDGGLDRLLSLIGNGFSSIFAAATPSSRMNPKYLIPLLLAAILLGAVLHFWFGERYRFQALGNGAMMKTDRWTGTAWTLQKTYNGDEKREYWDPVDPSKNEGTTANGTKWKRLSE